MRRRGGVFEFRGRWMMQVKVRGQRFRQLAVSSSKRKAEEECALWAATIEQDVLGGREIPTAATVTVGQLLDLLLSSLRLRSIKRIEFYECVVAKMKRLLVSGKTKQPPVYFGDEKAAALTDSRHASATLRAKKPILDGVPVLEWYVTERLTDTVGKHVQRPLKRTTVNRDFQVLRQAMRLGFKRGLVARLPEFPLAREDNARQGFFSLPEVEALGAELPEPLPDVARFAFFSAWRRSEILDLLWESVDRTTSEVRLRTTKNASPRTLPLEGELAAIIERQWARRIYQPRHKDGSANGPPVLSRFVFHIRGRRVGEFYKTWNTACRKAGLAGRLLHDMRRSGVRELVRSGVNESVAMSISGHKTKAMFLRYDIVSDTDKRDALRQREEYSRRAARVVQPLKREVSK